MTANSRVFLRPLTEDDFTGRYLDWFRDPQVTRFLDARNITRDDAVGHLRRGKESNTWRLYAICRAEDNRHIGNLKIGPIDWRHLYSDFVTVIGERSAWGRGHARDSIRQGIDIAFGEMKLRKLSASIDSLNLASVKAYTAAGFTIEGRLARHFMREEVGRCVFSDKIYVACFNPQFSTTPRQATE